MFGTKCEDDDNDIDNDTTDANDTYWMLTVYPPCVKCFTYINTTPCKTLNLEILNHFETNRD